MSSTELISIQRKDSSHHLFVKGAERKVSHEDV